MGAAVRVGDYLSLKERVLLIFCIVLEAISKKPK